MDGQPVRGHRLGPVHRLRGWAGLASPGTGGTWCRDPVDCLRARRGGRHGHPGRDARQLVVGRRPHMEGGPQGVPVPGQGREWCPGDGRGRHRRRLAGGRAGGSVLHVHLFRRPRSRACLALERRAALDPCGRGPEGAPRRGHERGCPRRERVRRCRRHRRAGRNLEVPGRVAMDQGPGQPRVPAEITQAVVA